ncbi:MAG: hypothetical protein KA257_05150 [Opitutaceae bacterium]|nr:hypothetical protein [Opitutaceae bacterium]
MFRRLLIALSATALLGSARGTLAEETNAWPAWVSERNASGQMQGWQAVGPLFFKNSIPGNDTYRGFRPLYLRRDDAEGNFAESTFLYPLFIQRQTGQTRTWSVFNLINHSGPTQAQVGDIEPRSFDVWPFYFSRDTGSATTSYHALFPVGGSIQNRFGYDRLSWTLFPLYWRSERAEVVTTSTLWPFIKRSSGGGHHGFAFWPLFGYAEKPGAYRKQYFLWPLIYKNESLLSDTQPAVKEGFLPFYTRERQAGMVNVNFLWPFFGYTDRQAPKSYHEVRYLWPLLVQGRGEARYVNRWGPLYTHSIAKGVDQQWFMWPFIRQQDWADDSVRRVRTQLLYFVYWSEEQSSLANPSLPHAEKTHFWPLLSVWDNGAGRRQVQFPSPLEVFFPANNKVRQLYSPFFALYRYDRRSPTETRTALFWNAITWYRTAERREFHLGPLFSSQASADGQRIALGNGVIGIRRAAGRGGWRLFLFDFSRQSDKSNVSQSR